MKLVYLIISHTNGEQVARLAGHLVEESPSGRAVILHAADGSDLGPLVPNDRVQVLPYKPKVYWGDYSLLDKVLYGLRWVSAHLTFDWLMLLSGQDYPLRPLLALEHELEATAFDAFVSGAPILSGQSCGKIECALEQHPAASCRRCQELYLYQYWRLPSYRLARKVAGWVNRRAGDRGRGLPLLRVQRLAQPGSKLGTMLGVRAVSPPFSASFPCHKGKFWLTANRAALTALLDTIASSPRLMRYYRHTILPDESLFVTILKNARGLRVGDDGFHFVNWTDANAPSPAIIREADFERVVASGAFFGRKFDSRVDAAILDHLDAFRGAHHGAPA